MIKYSAVVTMDAKDGESSNTAKIGYKYSDSPNTDPTPVDRYKTTET
ncbi:hypothetical protein ACJBW9_10955 [Streptococcus suis]